MRTFKPMIVFVFACFVTLAACGGSGGGDDMMGDDDVAPDAGGDPEGCSTADDQVCLGPVGEPADCSSGTCVCNDSALPVYCADDGHCWPEGTDCGEPAFPCGPSYSRCEAEGQAANCCGGTAYLCPEDKPYYCTDDRQCHAHSSECPASTCEYYGAGC